MERVLACLNSKRIMRIQEMRSGISQLSKRTADTLAPSDTFEWRELNSVSLSDDSETLTEISCDLELPEWSVVSFDKVEAGGLKYWQAAELVRELEAHGIAGLCIITDDAATRAR